MRALTISLLMLVCLQLHAQSGTPAPEPEGPSRALLSAEEREQARQQRLAEASDPDSVRWLTVGDHKVLALYAPEFSGAAKGGVLILHEYELQPGWPGSLTRLREQLPDKGWHSLAVSLAPVEPVPPPARVLPALGAEAGASSKANEDVKATEAANAAAPALAAPDQPQTAAPGTDNLARIASAVAFFHEQRVFNLVIVAEGRAALEAARYLQSLAPPAQGAFETIQGLVMVDPQHQDTQDAPDLRACIKTLRIPTLDITTQYEASARQRAKERDLVSRSLPLGRYQQLRIPPTAPGVADSPDRLTQRITAWINAKLAGEEIGAG